MRRLARSLRVVVVDPDANLIPAMRAGAFGLRQGRPLILYPEGERSIDGTPKIFKKGAAILVDSSAGADCARGDRRILRSVAEEQIVPEVHAAEDGIRRSDFSAAGE